MLFWPRRKNYRFERIRPKRTPRPRNRPDEFIQLRLTRLEERRVLDAAGLVADIQPGAVGSNPQSFTEFAGSLYFSAAGRDTNGTVVGRELFRLDAGGRVSLVADINPGAADSDPGGFVEFEGDLYFAATGINGREFYRLDAAGNVALIADIRPGAASSSPAEFTPFDGDLYFAATGASGREFYRLLGNQTVQLVDDIQPGSGSSNPAGFTEFEGKLYFAASGPNGRELYILNHGNQVNQSQDINPGTADASPSDLIVFNGGLYFAATTSNGRGLFRQQASGVNPVQIVDVSMLSNPRDFTEFDGQLYFRATSQQSGGELFRLDATENVVSVGAVNGNGLLAPSGFREFNDTLYFGASMGSDRFLFRLDQSGPVPTAIPIPLPAETTLPKDEPAGLSGLQLFAGSLYFIAVGPGGRELYRVDGTGAVVLAADINAGAGNGDPLELTVFNDKLYFSASQPTTGRELFVLIPSGSSLVIVGNDLVFEGAVGDENNRLIVSTDGTNLLLRDENGYSIFSVIPSLTGSGTNSVSVPLAQLSGIERFVIDTRFGFDSVTLDLSHQANAILDAFNSVLYDGGPPSVAAGDLLRVVGDGTLISSYVPDAIQSGKGVVSIRSTSDVLTVNLVNLEPVEFTGLLRAEMVSPGTMTGKDDWTIAAGVDALTHIQAALVVGGTSGGIVIQRAYFFDNALVVIDTGAGTDGRDAITIADTGVEHDNRALVISTGDFTGALVDTVRIVGNAYFLDDAHIHSDAIELAATLSAGRSVELVADDAITMTASAVIDGGGGTVELIAAGDITLGRVVTTNSTPQAIRIESTAGRLLEAGDLYAADIDVSSGDAVVTITVFSAVGDPGNMLDTHTRQLIVTSGGDQFIHEIDRLDSLRLVTSGNVLLQSVGPIGDSDADVDVIAAGLDLTVTGIGNVGTAAHPIGLDVQSLAIDTSAHNGAQFVSEIGNLMAIDLDAAIGNISLTAGAAVLDGDSFTDLVAASAVLVSGAGIGTATNPLESRLSQLEGAGGSGGLFVNNTGDLVVGGVTGQVSGLSAQQGIWVSTVGGLRVLEPVVSGAGPVSLSASGGLEVSSEVVTSGGRIEITAGGDLLVRSPARLESGSETAGVTLIAGGALTLQDGTQVLAKAGPVELTAGGDLTLSLVMTSGAVTARAGGAMLDTQDSGGNDLVAASAVLVSGAGIGTATNPLESRLSQLEGAGGSGGLFVNNTGDLVVGGVTGQVSGLSAQQGIWVSTVGGLRVLEPVVSGAGPVSLSASGGLEVSSEVVTSGGRIEITAGGDLLVRSPARLESGSETAGVTLIAGGALTLQDGTQVLAKAGPVELTAGGDLTLSLVMTSGAVTARAGGAMLDTQDSGGNDLVAASAVLVSGAGIGTATNPLESRLSQLEGAGGSGGLFVNNTGDLVVGGVTGQVSGLSAQQGIWVSTVGGLRVLEPVVSGAGPVSLSASGGLEVSSEVVTSGGRIEITAGGDLLVRSPARLESGSETAGVTLIAGGALTLQDGTQVLAKAGPVELTAGGDLTLSLVMTSGAVTARAGGAMLDTQDSGGNDLVAASAVLVSGAGIGTATNPLESRLSQLEGAGGSGGLFVNNTGDLVVGGVTGQVSGLSAQQGIWVSTVGGLRVLEPVVSGAGPVSLSASGGLEVSSEVVTSGGRIEITAGGDLLVRSPARLESGSETAGVTLIAGGALTLQDGTQVLAKAGPVELTAGGDLTLSLVMTSGAVTARAGGAMLDTQDSGGNDLVAASAVLVSGAGIGTATNPLESRLSQLEGAGGSGGLFVNNTGDLVVGGVTGQVSGLSAQQGIWVSTVGGLRVLEPVVSGAGPVSLSASGGLEVSSEVVTSGGRIEITAGGDLLVRSPARLESGSETAGVTLIAGGALTLQDGTQVLAKAGPVELTAGGDLTLSLVMTSGAVTARAGGAMLDTQDSGGNDLVAASAVLVSGAGIGTATNPLESRLSQLEGAGGSGGLFVNNTGDLVVGGVTGQVSGLSAQQGIWVSTVGGLRVLEPVVSGAGPVSLSASGGLEVSSEVVTSGGRIEITAGGDLLVRSPARLESGSETAGVTLIAGGALTLQDGTQVLAKAGPVELTAGGDLTLSLVMTSGAVTARAGGAMLDTQDSGGNDLVAASAVLVSGAGIGTATNPLESRLSQLEGAGGSGGLWLVNGTSLRIGNTAVPGSRGITTGGPVEIHVAGSLAIAGSVFGSANATVSFHATHDVFINASIITGTGDTGFFAGNDIRSDVPTKVQSAGGDVLFMADSDGNHDGTVNLKTEIDLHGGMTTIHLADADGALSGSITGAGGLMKLGAGTLTLTSTSFNTYTGPTILDAGVLVIDGTIGAAARPAAALSIGQATLRGSGDVFASVDATDPAARIESTGNLRLGDGGNNGFRFAGTLVIGAGNVVTLRDGDLAELGVLTVLRPGAVIAAAEGIEISGGDALVGDGTIDGHVLVLAGGRLMPGTSGTGVLRTADLFLSPGAIVEFDVRGVSPGDGHDQLVVSGALSLDGAQLIVRGGVFTAPSGTEIALIDNDGADAIRGTLTDADSRPLAQGSSVTLGGTSVVLSYTAGLGANALALTLARQTFFFTDLGSDSTQTAGENAAEVAAISGLPLASEGERSETRHPTAGLTAATEATAVGQVSAAHAYRPHQFESQLKSKLRVFFRVHDDALMQEGSREYELRTEDLGDVLGVFRRHRFPNGHYRVYVQEPGARRERLLLDVHIYDGNVVPEGYREEEGGVEQGARRQANPDRSKAMNQEVVPPESSGAADKANEDPDRPADDGDSSSRNTEESNDCAADNHRPGQLAAGSGLVLGSLTIFRSPGGWRQRVRAALENGQYSLAKSSRLARRIRPK